MAGTKFEKLDSTGWLGSEVDIDPSLSNNASFQPGNIIRGAMGEEMKSRIPEATQAGTWMGVNPAVLKNNRAELPEAE